MVGGGGVYLGKVREFRRWNGAMNCVWAEWGGKTELSHVEVKERCQDFSAKKLECQGCHYID